MSSYDQDQNDTPEKRPKRPERTPGRRLSRKGISRDRGEDLNAHAKAEAHRKAARRAAGTPSRDDVAHAALHALLYSLASRPDAPGPQAFRDLTVSRLGRALFDPEETQRVLRVWRAGGCQSARPERPANTGKIPRRPNGTMPWTYTEPRPPGPQRIWRRRRGSSDDAI